MTYDDLIVYTYEDPLFNVSFDYYEVEPVNKAIEELKELLHEAETRADLAKPEEPYRETYMNKWIIIGALGNLALVILNAINLYKHWD